MKSKSNKQEYKFIPIGMVMSAIKDKSQSPIQGRPNNIPAQIEIFKEYTDALYGLENRKHIYLLLWLHMSNRDMLQSFPKNDVSLPAKGVFAIRSASRPNPIGLHLVDLVCVKKNILFVKGLEAIDKTPVLDIKPYDSDLDKP